MAGGLLSRWGAVLSGLCRVVCFPSSLFGWFLGRRFLGRIFAGADVTSRGARRRRKCGDDTVLFEPARRAPLSFLFCRRRLPPPPPPTTRPPSPSPSPRSPPPDPPRRRAAARSSDDDCWILSRCSRTLMRSWADMNFSLSPRASLRPSTRYLRKAGAYRSSCSEDSQATTASCVPVFERRHMYVAFRCVDAVLSLKISLKK